MFRRAVRRAAVLGASAAVVALGLVVAPTGAGAFGGGETGALRIHGPGSVFAGSRALVSQVVSAPGATATFAVQVKNTGPATAQFNVQIVRSNVICGGSCSFPTVKLSSGSVVVTPLAGGPNGYFTPPVAAGSTAALTLKVTTPKAPYSAPGDTWEYDMFLYDTAGNYLDFEYTYVSNKLAVGTTAVDAYTSASGTAATTSHPTGAAVVTAPTLAIGATASFTVKLKNDSALPGPIRFSLIGVDDGCTSYFTQKVKAGSTDVTTAVFNDTYSTPTLAHGASVTLTITVKYLAAGAFDCLDYFTGAGFILMFGTAYNNTTSVSSILAANLIAEN